MKLGRRSAAIVLVLLALAGGAVIVTVLRNPAGVGGQGIVPWLLSFLATVGGAVAAAVRSDQAKRRVDDVHGLVEGYRDQVEELLEEHGMLAGRELRRVLGHRPVDTAVVPPNCPRDGHASCCVFDPRRARCEAAVRAGVIR